MFKKLFKYDLRSIKRFVLPILIVLVAVTLVGALDGVLFVKLIENIPDDAEAGVAQSLFLVISYMVLLFVIMAIGSVSYIVQILIMVDYYRFTVSDEAYLTFTLPVRAKDIILSKLANSSIWNVIVKLAGLISMAIIVISMVLAAIPGYTDSPSTDDIPADPVSMPQGSGLFIVILILFFIAYFINSQLLYFMTITFSSTITRKHKVLSAIGCVIGVNFIYGTVSSIIMFIAFLIGGAVGSAVDNTFTIFNVSFGIMTALLIGLCFLFYFATKHMMEKKLNLA